METSKEGGGEELESGVLNLLVVGETDADAKLRTYGIVTGKPWQPVCFPAPSRIVLSPCPYLPEPPEAMSWKDLAAQRAERGAGFYAAALTYGNYLWRRRLPARAILCLDRAFGAELASDEPVLSTWPLPYAAMAWLLAHAPADVFIGNPRVHFQHYAGRMNEPRREQRRWRAWACWAIARKILPQLPGDPRHVIEEPSLAQIDAALTRHGHPGEARLWSAVYESASRSL